ncbi:siderophore ABC transporter substrate-binding protein [Pseudomonas profundi]|uniref:siderophore ABC transporter substrate-binding protein n=1 Tax=Pseudomonas profundi TaxID=1981513 RepID=UPI001CC24AE3|nr:ABC transporter substrate-binding protein [Pseudomonas profundi]
MKLLTPLAILATAVSLSAPVSAFEITHSAGTLTLDSTPEKIVTFDLAALDTLDTLDIPVAGVPQSTYTGNLEKFNETPVVGSLFEPDYSKLKDMSPELIIAGGRSQKAMPQLQEVAPTISFTADPSDFLASFKSTNQALAKAFDKDQQAQAALADIDHNVAALRKANEGKTGAFLFTMRGNVMAHAPGDRFGYAYELTGLQSVLPPITPDATRQPRPEPGTPEAEAAAKARAQTITTVAQAEPDWLIVLDRGAINGGEKTAADTLAQHPQLSETAAFKEGRVYYVDPNSWYLVGGGLTNLENITEQMLSAMQ